MTPEQLKILEDIIEKLSTSCSALLGLTDPLFGLDKDYVEQAAKLPDLISTFLGLLGRLNDLALEVLANDSSLSKGMRKIEALILAAGQKTVEDKILVLQTQSAPLIETLIIANKSGKLAEEQAQRAFGKLSQLCEQLYDACTSEIASLKELDTPVQAQTINLRVNQTPMLVTGQVTIGKNQITSETGELLAEFEPRSASETLNQMRTKYGIVAIKHFNIPVTIPIAERALLYNTALNLLGRYPLELCVKAVIAPPVGEQKILANYYISKEKTITIRFEQYAPLLIPITFTTLEDVKQHLLGTYHFEAIQEEDTPWQLEELNQVAAALNKLAKRPQDVIVLTGCTLIRTKESKDDDPDAKVGGCYTPGKHTLTLTNAAFASNTKSFYGIKNICPSSHGIILHEVGHVIEFHDWQAQRKQSNEGIQAIEAKLVKQQQLVEQLLAQWKEVEIACAQEWQSYQDRMNAEQEEHEKAITEAQQEFKAVRAQVTGFFDQAINRYNGACDAVPRQAPPLFDTYLKQLLAVLQALKPVNLSDPSLDPTVLTPALTALKQAQEIQAKLKLLIGENEEYQYIAYQAQSSMESVIEIAKLYPSIKQLVAQLRHKHDEWLKADDLQQEELNKKHKAETAKAKKEYLEQQDVYVGLIQQSLSTQISVLKDAQKMYIERKPTPCLEKFIVFVTQNNISPITPYAQKEWEKGNKSEFFADAYQLFLNDPEFLQAVSQALYAWFENGEYIRGV